MVVDRVTGNHTFKSAVDVFLRDVWIEVKLLGVGIPDVESPEVVGQVIFNGVFSEGYLERS